MDISFTPEVATLFVSLFCLILLFIGVGLLVYLVIRGSTPTRVTDTPGQKPPQPGPSRSNFRLATTSSGGIRKFLVVGPGVSTLSASAVPTIFNYDSDGHALSVANSNKYVGVDKDGNLILTDTPSQNLLMYPSSESKFQLISDNGLILSYDPSVTGTGTSKVTLLKESDAPPVIFEPI